MCWFGIATYSNAFSFEYRTHQAGANTLVVTIAMTWIVCQIFFWSWNIFFSGLYLHYSTHLYLPRGFPAYRQAGQYYFRQRRTGVHVARRIIGGQASFFMKNICHFFPIVLYASWWPTKKNMAVSFVLFQKKNNRFPLSSRIVQISECESFSMWSDG